MQTRPVIIADVGLKRASKRFFAEHNDMVQTLPADRTNDTFHIRVLPRRSWRTKDFLDAHNFNLFGEFVSVDPIAISQQIFRSAVERKSFDDLLCRPFRCRMSGDVEMEDTPAVMGEHNEHKNNLEPDRVHREEID